MTERKSKKLRSKKEQVEPTTQTRQDEQVKREEFWSDPCWREPFRAQE